MASQHNSVNLYSYCRDVQTSNANKLVTWSKLDYSIKTESTRIPYPNTIGQRGDSGLLTQECWRWLKEGQKGQLESS